MATVTWHRKTVVELCGSVELREGVTVEQVQEALDSGNYESDDVDSIIVCEPDEGIVIAEITGCEEQCEDEYDEDWYVEADEPEVLQFPTST